jgi:predicted AlkP superfamily pyrophosphatase or phosphodiesterase
VEAHRAEQVVLLVLDGLGWQQLQERTRIAPTMTGMSGGPVSTVVPTTTATGLTSIAVGVPPGEHGVVGYRIATHGSILNVLRWRTGDGDARRSVVPADFQPIEPFLGQRPPVVTRADFTESGFTQAHLRGTQWHPWRVPSTLVAEVVLLIRAGEPFVYAYYDGIDKVAHDNGLAIHYEAELRFVDRLVANLLDLLPDGTVLVVTADHGQVQTGDAVVSPDPAVLELTASQSGEARFRWLHARPGRAEELLARAEECHGEQAWVFDVDTLIGDGWFGPVVRSPARARFGDVALVAKGNIAFDDPNDTGPVPMIGRHGSVTDAEVLVPLLAARA